MQKKTSLSANDIERLKREAKIPRIIAMIICCVCVIRRSPVRGGVGAAAAVTPTVM